MALLEPLAATGRISLAFMESVGKLSLFAGTTAGHTVTPPYYVRNLARQFMVIGFYSLPVVGLTALFTGMVLALQAYTRFSGYAQGAVASLVALSVTRELGPVIAGLMVAGRVGAAIAAETGTMRVTDQIDALQTLSTNPFKYLVSPRVIAGMIVLPLLVLVADSIGILGGYLIAVYKQGLNGIGYMRQTIDFIKLDDITSGLIKAAVFGVIITLMGCYNGYYSKGGAQGVGAATTNAVVSASILILLFDTLMTSLFFS